jgi:N-methylhydantoinase A
VGVPLQNGRLDEGSRDPIIQAFEQVYQQLYQRTGPAVGLEVINWRLVVSGPRPELKLAANNGGGGPDLSAALKGQREAYVHEEAGYRAVPVYDRYRLTPGTSFRGPAVVEERESTVVIGPRGRVSIDQWRNLRVDFEPAGSD